MTTNDQTMQEISVRELPLDQRIGFRVQRISTLLTTQAVSRLRQSGGLTLNQWRMLTFPSGRNALFRILGKLQDAIL